MSKIKKTKWFHYSQNNSGGSFDINEKSGIGTDVIIEAIDSDQANLRAENIGLYFNGCEEDMDCPCCGDRWYPSSDKGDKVPSIYGKSLEKVDKSGYREMAFIHPLKGKFKKIKFKVSK